MKKVWAGIRRESEMAGFTAMPGGMRAGFAAVSGGGPLPYRKPCTPLGRGQAFLIVFQKGNAGTFHRSLTGRVPLGGTGFRYCACFMKRETRTAPCGRRARSTLPDERAD